MILFKINFEKILYVRQIIYNIILKIENEMVVGNSLPLRFPIFFFARKIKR